MGNRERQLFEKEVRRYCLFQVIVTSISVLLFAVIQLVFFSHLRLLQQQYYYLCGLFFLTGVFRFILNIRRFSDKTGLFQRLYSLHPFLRLLLCLMTFCAVLLHSPAYGSLFALQTAGCYFIQMFFERLYDRRIFS